MPARFSPQPHAIAIIPHADSEVVDLGPHVFTYTNPAHPEHAPMRLTVAQALAFAKELRQEAMYAKQRAKMLGKALRK